MTRRSLLSNKGCEIVPQYNQTLSPLRDGGISRRSIIFIADLNDSTLKTASVQQILPLAGRKKENRPFQKFGAAMILEKSQAVMVNMAHFCTFPLRVRISPPSTSRRVRA